MAVEYLPFSNWELFAFRILSAEPIILLNIEYSEHPHAEEDGWDVGQEHVSDEMIPPAFSQMGHDVLEREFNEFIQKLPEEEDVKVSTDKGSQEPIDTMNNEVMVEVTHDVLIGEFTIVIISMDLCVQRDV